MENYETLVSRAFTSKSPLPFSNDSAVHARVIMKHIFQKANGKVCLYSDELPGNVDITETQTVDVYDWMPLLNATEEFLKKPHSKFDLKIDCAESDGISSSRFIELLKKYPEKTNVKWDVKSTSNNFMFNDANAFRFEYNNHQAIACASNEDVVVQLSKLYDSI